MRLLVTGGTGQVGEALIRLAPELGITVTAPGRDLLDLSRPGTIGRVLGDAVFDGIVSSGAYTAVDRAESEAELAETVNARAPGVLAALAASRGLPIVHISTDYVFDGSKPTPYVESDPVAPLQVYGRTKEAGERAVRAGNPRHAVMRTSWVYSAHGANFVKTMLRLGRERDQLKIVADQTGAPTLADDIARAAVACARGLRDGAASGTFHYTAKGATTWHGLASAIWDTAGPRLGRRPEIAPIPSASYPTPAARPLNSRLDSAKIEAAFAVPRRDWAEALDETLSRLLETRS